MKYMVLIAGSEEERGAVDEQERAAAYQQILAWWREHQATGEILAGDELQPSDTATTVRRSPEGAVTVTDGPFVEGKEMVGGYGIIDVPDLDAAIRLVSSWPGLPATLEIRPIITS
jgi:hypothetical protein